MSLLKPRSLLPVVLCGLIFSGRPAAGGVRFGEEVIELYKAGRLDAARKRLSNVVKRQIWHAERLREGDGARRNLELRLGISLSASLLVRCFALEAKHGDAANVPQELVALSQEVLDNLTTVLEDVRKAPTAPPRNTGYAQRRKKLLLTRLIAALRSAGQEERARAVVARYRKFIDAQRIPVEHLAPKVTMEFERGGDTEEIVSGRALAIFQLLLRYYRARSQEDAEAIDRCLVKEASNVTGKDMVESIAAERARTGRFDALGPIRFDAKSLLRIIPRADNEFNVQVGHALKSLRVGGNLVQYREGDRFLVRQVENEYKIIVKRRRGE
jgi:hypothetical protein